MRKILLSGIVVVTIAACSSAQKNQEKSNESEIPELVRNAFKEHYPDVSDADWEKEGSEYEVSFEKNKQEISVVLDATGKILETETEIETGELPQAARDYVAANYKGQKLKEAAKIVLSDGTIQYEAEVNKKDLLFDQNGSFIKEIAD